MPSRSGAEMAIALEVLATPENFDEAAYLAANPDVAEAYRRGAIKSPRRHFDEHGRREQRRLRLPQSLEAARADKMRRIEPLLNLAMPHVRRGVKYDFLSDALRRETGIVDTTAVSAHEYSGHTLALIKQLKDGLILDCGAGQRPTYHTNVVNYEIADYETTDVLGVGEALPFRDNCFDAVFSLSVLEHVRDPFACRDEIVRVLKPGGTLICSVPHLAPLHGYPHHYYNMTGQGLRALFERHLKIEQHFVGDAGHPIWALSWIVRSWADGLSGGMRRKFLGLRLGDLLSEAPDKLLNEAWARGLAEEKQFEIAATTLLIAHKAEQR